MLVVLRVKEIPSRSREGIIILNGIAYKLFVPLHPIYFFACSKCLDDGNQEKSAYITCHIGQAKAPVTGYINFEFGKEGDHIGY